MGRYYETFPPPFALTMRGTPIPEYQHAYAFDADTTAVDERLTAAVEQRLGALGGVLDIQSVEVRVQRGFVTLTGQVATQRVRDAVYAFADRTVGVRGVRDLLTIVPPPSPPLDVTSDS